MNEFLTILTTKTAILTAFALLVGAATALVRRLDAKTTQLCWAFVLASGIVGGIAPFGPTLPGIFWKTNPETPPTPTAPTETVIETEIQTPTQPAPPTFAEVEPRWEPRPEPTQFEFSQSVSEIPFETPEPEPLEIAVASPPEPRPEPEPTPTPPLETASEPLPNANDLDVSAVSDVSEAQPLDVRRLVFALYWAGVFAALAFGTVAAIRLRLALRTAVPADDASTELLRREAFAIGLPPRRVERLRLLTTKRIGPALVVDGFFSAAVVVPENFWNEASQVVKIGVLRHELAHWKRRDLVFSTAARAIRALHWFNPAAFWAVRRYDEAVENRCDELAFGGGDVGAALFVEAILATRESREIYSVLQKKFGGSACLRRARNLQKLDERKNPMLKRTITLGVVAAFCVAILGWKIGGGNDKKPGASDSLVAAEIAAQAENNDKIAPTQTVAPAEKTPDAPGTLEARFKAELAARSSESAATPFAGTVVDADGNPAPGARVWAVSDFGGSLDGIAAPQIAVADENGRFELKLPSTPQPVCVFAVSADATRIGVSRGYFNPDVSRFNRLESQIELRPGTIVSGTVVDANGNPVEGATLRAVQSGVVANASAGPFRRFADDSTGAFASLVATSDADGAFRFVFPFADGEFESETFGTPPEWLERRFCAFKDGVGIALAQRVVAFDGEKAAQIDFNAPIRLTLEESAALPVRVVDKREKAVFGEVKVDFEPQTPNAPTPIPFDGAPFETFVQRTDGDGNATLVVPRRPSENARLNVRFGESFENDRPRAIEPETLPLVDALGRRDGDAPLRIKTRFKPRIVGTVKNADGSPAPDALIWRTAVPKGESESDSIWRRTHSAPSSRVFVDKNGEFAQPFQPDETKTLNFGARSASGAAPFLYDLKIDPETNDVRVDFVLSKGIKVSGNVFPPRNFNSDPETVEISAFRDANAPTTSPFVRFETKSDKSGRFEAVLPAVPGEYRLYCPTVPEPLKLEVRGDETEIKFDFFASKAEIAAGFAESLERRRRLAGRNLSGTVVDANGQPAAGARVWGVAQTGAAYNPESPSAAPEIAVADANGRFELNLPPYQTYSVFAISADETKIGSRSGFYAPEERINRFDKPIKLEAGTVFSGTVVDADGNPVEGATVRAVQNVVKTSNAPEPNFRRDVAGDDFASLVATSDASGAFRFVFPKIDAPKTNGVFGDRLERRFCAVKDGAGIALAQTLDYFGLNADAEPLRLTLEEAAPLPIRVVDKRENPVSLARISAEFETRSAVPFDGSPFEAFSQTTNDAGEATLLVPKTTLEKARLNVRPGVSTENGDRRETEPETLALADALKRRDGDAPLRIETRFRPRIVGTVKNADGSPATDATVFLTQLAPDLRDQTIRRRTSSLNSSSFRIIDKNGKFNRSLGVGDGAEPEPVCVGAISPSGASAFLFDLKADPETAEIRVDLTVSKGIKVSGKVYPINYHAAFKPTTVRIAAFQDPDAPTTSPFVVAKTESDDSGRFETFLPAVPGEYWLGCPNVSSPRKLEVRGDETEIEFDFFAKPDAKTAAPAPPAQNAVKNAVDLTGTFFVVSADDPSLTLPAVGARVWLEATDPAGRAVQPAPVETDENGKYAIKLPKGPSFRLYAQSADGTQVGGEAFPVAAIGDQPIVGQNLLLKNVSHFVGTVVDENGAPLPGARVCRTVAELGGAISNDSTPSTALPRTVVADASGRFELPVPPPAVGADDRIYAISADETRIGVVSSAAFAQGKTAKIEARPGVVLSGTVVDANGNPVEGATVRAIQDPFGIGATSAPENLASLVATSDAKGEFRFVFFGTLNRDIPVVERRFVALKEGVGLGLAQQIASAADAVAPESDFNAPIRLTLDEYAPLALRFVDKRDATFKRSSVALDFDLGTPLPTAVVDAPPQQVYRWKNQDAQPSNADGTPLFSGDGFETFVKTTNADGETAFAFVPQKTTERDRLRLNGYATDREHKSLRGVDADKRISLRDAQVRRVDAGTPVEIVAPTWKTISGTIKTADGSKLENPSVYLTTVGADGSIKSRSVPIQANDKYHFPFSDDVKRLSVVLRQYPDLDRKAETFVGVRFDAPPTDWTRLDLTLDGEKARVSGEFIPDADAPPTAQTPKTLEIDALQSGDENAVPVATTQVALNESARFETTVPAPPKPRRARATVPGIATKDVAELFGTVFDADGKPAVGARVWVEALGPSEDGGSAAPKFFQPLPVETDANGKFDLQVPKDRQLELFARSADGTQIGRPVAPLLAPILRSGSPIEREIRLKKGVVVSGTVVDAAGKPVEGATVEGLQGPTRLFGAVYLRLNGDRGVLNEAAKSVATSDKNGAFRLVFPFSDNRETLLGSERRIVAFKDGVGLGFVQKFRDPEDANGSNADFNAALRLTLRETAPLTVRVVDRLGAPVRGSTVVAFPLSGDPAQDSPTLTSKGVNVASDGFDGTGFAPLSKTTDADGNATFELLPKGEDVGALYVFGGRSASPGVRIDRDSALTTRIPANDGGVLEVKVGSLRRIFGTVKNADGSPAANARVAATTRFAPNQVFNKRTPTSTEEGKTNEKGEYEIFVHVDPASVGAESENGVSLPVFDVKIDEKTGESRVDLTLKDRIRVFGRARYGANSGMVSGDAPNFSVVALSDDGANPKPFVRDVEPKKGEFEFYVPAVPATYWIRFDSLTSVEFETPKLEIRGDEKEVEANFETKPVDLPPDFPSPERDANGKITAVSREKFVGKVVDASGNPAANATVRLTSRDRFLKNPPTTRTDANGRFELPNFSRENLEKVANGLMGPAELYLLATTADGSQCGETFVGAIWRDVLVDPAAKTGAENGDATNETEIRTLPGRVFAGTIVDESGAPLEGASVWVGKPGEPIYVATTDASGKYRIPIDKRIPTWSLFAFKKGVGFVAFSGSVPETRRFGWEPDLTQPEAAADAPTRITLRRRVATVAFVDESGEPLAGLTVAPRFDAKDVARAAKTPIGWPGGFQFWGFLFDEFLEKTNDKGEITLEILPSEPTPDAEPSQTFLAKVNLDASLGNFAQNGGRSLDREQKIAISAAQIKPNPDGTGIAPIKIVVKRPPAVFGKVVNPDGTPAANADVFYFIDNHTSPGVVQTNEKGEYEIVEPSTSRVGAVAASGPNGAAATVSMKTVADRPRRARVDFQLTDGVKVFGTIKAPERDYVRFEETELDKFGNRNSNVIARWPAVYDKETGRYEIWLPKTPRTYDVGRYVSQKRQELRIDGSETEIEFNIGAPTE